MAPCARRIMRVTAGLPVAAGLFLPNIMFHNASRYSAESYGYSCLEQLRPCTARRHKVQRESLLVLLREQIAE